MNYLKLWASLIIFFLLFLAGKAFADLTDIGEIVADLSEPLITTVPSTINKASVVDNGDYYILNTGKKASFLRLENTYLLVSDSKITSPAANTGQGGGLSDADVDAPEGWDISKGTGAVIAVYDDGRCGEW